MSRFVRTALQQELDLFVVEETSGSHQLPARWMSTLSWGVEPVARWALRWSLRSAVLRIGLFVGVIGVAGAAAQTPATALDALTVPVRDARLGTQLVDSFVPGRPEGWARGFALAESLGRAGVPLLVELAQRNDADARRRSLLLAAVEIGGGVAADPVLLSTITTVRDGAEGIRERVLVGLTLGLGERRETPAPVLTTACARARVAPLEQIALAVAAARFPGAVVPVAWLRSDEPGVVAAAAFAGAVDRTERVAGWLGTDRTRAGLVQRGFLLAAGSERLIHPTQKWVFRLLAERGEDALAARLATALCVARAPDPEVWLAREELPSDPELLAWLATEPAMRSALWQRGRLGPAPTRLPAESRGATAVAFALATDGDGLERTAAEWRRDPVAAQALCLGIAWRFFTTPDEADAAWLRWLPDVRELEWVRLACGQPALEPTRSMTDDALDRAFVVAVAPGDRLGRRAAALAIEAALWRSGAHPAATRIHAEQDLIRDLLLSGSEYGSAVLRLGTDPRLRYLPPGLAAGDDIFRIGYEVYRFLRDPARSRPAAARLR